MMGLKEVMECLEKDAQYSFDVFESTHAKHLEALWAKITATIIKFKTNNVGFVNDAMEVYIISYSNSNDVKEHAKMTFLHENSRFVERYLNHKFKTETNLDGYEFRIRTNTKQDSVDSGLNSYTTFCTLSIDLLRN